MNSMYTTDATKVNVVLYLIQALGLPTAQSPGSQPSDDLVIILAVDCDYFLPGLCLPLAKHHHTLARTK